MSERTKNTPQLSEEDLYYWQERNTVKQMNDEQRKLAEKRLELSAKALADEKVGQAVKAETDFERKIHSMTDTEFARFKQDLNWEAARKGNV